MGPPRSPLWHCRPPLWRPGTPLMYVILNPIGPLSRSPDTLRPPWRRPLPVWNLQQFPKTIGAASPQTWGKTQNTTILNREITPKSSREVRNIRCFQNWLVVFRYQSSIVFRMFFHNLQLCQSPWRKNLKLCTAPFRTFSAHFLHSSALGQSTNVTQVMQYLKWIRRIRGNEQWEDINGKKLFRSGISWITYPPPWPQFGQLGPLFSEVEIQDLKVSLDLRILYFIIYCIYAT